MNSLATTCAAGQTLFMSFSLAATWHASKTPIFMVTFQGAEIQAPEISEQLQQLEMPNPMLICAA